MQARPPSWSAASGVATVVRIHAKARQAWTRLMKRVPRRYSAFRQRIDWSAGWFKNKLLQSAHRRLLREQAPQ
jgi:tryptophan 2,3-dioxygenase